MAKRVREITYYRLRSELYNDEDLFSVYALNVRGGAVKIAAAAAFIEDNHWPHLTIMYDTANPGIHSRWVVSHYGLYAGTNRQRIPVTHGEMTELLETYFRPSPIGVQFVITPLVTCDVLKHYRERYADSFNAHKTASLLGQVIREDPLPASVVQRGAAPVEPTILQWPSLESRLLHHSNEVSRLSSGYTSPTIRIETTESLARLFQPNVTDGMSTEDFADEHYYGGIPPTPVHNDEPIASRHESPVATTLHTDVVQPNSPKKSPQSPRSPQVRPDVNVINSDDEIEPRPSADIVVCDSLSPVQPTPRSTDAATTENVTEASEE